MSKGFIFNHNKCVACYACSVACIMQNRWTIQARSILTFNSFASKSQPVINLSLACNHCELPVCMEGCPTNSYSKELLTGAVLIDNKKCIGCKYCQWLCPYSAPKFDSASQIIGKCNFCYTELLEGKNPSCTNACPTGALDYGELPEQDADNTFSWFPNENFNPAIRLTGKQNSNGLKIIPEYLFEPEVAIPKRINRDLTNNWSLLIFSFLSTLSVGLIISSLIGGHFPDKAVNISIIILAGVISLFHLGKKTRAWRAIANLKGSRLSREIASFIIYAVVSLSSLFFQIPVLLIIASIIGLGFLLILDSVYILADKRKHVALNSGQTFITALLIASFISGVILPFVFIGLTKIATSFHRMIDAQKIRSFEGIRFIRISLLLITGASLVSKISFTDPVVLFLFLAGEFLDRFLFYSDFCPLNINDLIEKQINNITDEKKRD